MTERPSNWLVDLHGAVVIYAGAHALAGISARATDLLWSDLPALRPVIDVVFGYTLALLLVGGHACLRWRPQRAVPVVIATLAWLASVCASQLLARGMSLPQYSVYEGDSLATLLASLAVLAGFLRHAPRLTGSG